LDCAPCLDVFGGNGPVELPLDNQLTIGYNYHMKNTKERLVHTKGLFMLSDFGVSCDARKSVLLTNKFREITITFENALQLSIAKWIFIVEYLESGGSLLDDGGTHTCPLCHIYHKDKCVNCPVALSGHPGCINTPYVDFYNCPNLADAQAELGFLKSLRQRVT